MNNIKVTDRPVWGDNCTQCLACYHICPVHAVEYGKVTAKKGQYKGRLLKTYKCEKCLYWFYILKKKILYIDIKLSIHWKVCRNPHELKITLVTEVELHPKSWTQNFRSAVHTVVTRVISIKGKYSLLFYLPPV